MTVYVETDFLLALIKEDDWLQERAETVLENRDVVTSAVAYLEVLIVLREYQFDFRSLFGNLLGVVPVESDKEREIVLKAAAHVEDGMTPFDAYHAAMADTRGLPIAGSDKRYDEIDVRRIQLEPE